MSTEEAHTEEDHNACSEFLEARGKTTGNAAAAIQAALEAFEFEKLRKERLIVEGAARKKRIDEMREQGMSEDEIVDQVWRDLTSRGGR